MSGHQRHLKTFSRLKPGVLSSWIILRPAGVLSNQPKAQGSRDIIFRLVFSLSNPGHLWPIRYIPDQWSLSYFPDPGHLWPIQYISDHILQSLMVHWFFPDPGHLWPIRYIPDHVIESLMVHQMKMFTTVNYIWAWNYVEKESRKRSWYDWCNRGGWPVFQSLLKSF